MEYILKKESVKRVIHHLNNFNKDLKVQILYDSARTAKDAATALNCEIGAIVKSLLLRTKTSFVLCLVSGDEKCSLNKVKKILIQKDVSMASADEVKDQTGFSIGGVSPIAHLNKTQILIDSSLSKYQKVYAAAGHPNAIFGISYEKLIKITEGKEEDIIL
tara:strand:- start:3109 stop:3591 length:483 start_codon:yes stop_codon:yes gene_type:complete